MIKKPNKQEETSWSFTKRGRVEFGTTGNKINPNQRLEWDSNPGQPRANPTP